MSEHPILFSAPMVRAILEGRKTMTRRIVKPQPEHPDVILTMNRYGNAEADLPKGYRDANPGAMTGQDEFIPPHKPGDRVWVRETWTPFDNPKVIYRADCLTKHGMEDSDGRDIRLAYGCKWKPSIFMPRWASRITLEVEAVRVERVQDITEEDAVAEGMEWLTENHESPLCRQHPPAYASDGVCREPGYCECGNYYDTEHFKALWDSLNANRGYGWAVNPWVWVIQFKVIK